MREGRLAVTARYHLVADPGDKRPLAIDYAACPLEPVAVTCDSATHGVTGDTGRHIVVLELARRFSWNGASMEVVLKWPTHPRGPALAPSSYLIVPDQLPHPIEWPEIPRLPAAEVAVSLEEGMQLVAHLGSRMITSQARDNVFRKAVLCLEDVPVAVCDQGKWPEIRLTGRLSESSTVTPERICSVVDSAAQFLGEHLSARPALGFAIVTNATETTPEGTFSPLLVAEARRYAFPSEGGSGHPVQIGKMVALNWWGAGLKVEGPNGNQLAIAIAWACALLWTEEQYPSTYFQPLLTQYRALAKKNAAKWVHFRVGLPVYEWLKDDDSRWATLAEILHAGWDVWQPQDQFVAALAKAGVDLGRVLRQAPPDLTDYS